MSEGRTKVTKEILCEESRFILANVMAEARYGRQNRYDDIRRVCEGAISIPFSEYIGFLDSAGYLRHDRGSESLEVTPQGESIVNGGNLAELTERAVSHFKNARRRKSEEKRAVADREPMREPVREPVRDRPREALRDRGGASGRYNVSGTGRSSVVVGGEIQTSAELMDSRYEKLATIGSGGIGTVYRARQVPLNREVALKEIRDLFSYFSESQRNEITRRFTEVVRASAQLAHPNIVPIHEVNLDREFPYVVSELAPNGSCRRLIKDAETIPVGLVLKYLLQALHALNAAHSQRVFHRALKPENLLIDAYGNVKLSDFGFSKIVERDANVLQQVYVGMGNIAYMAPELYNDPGAAGPQTDIYAMGIIFYELLTRKLPGRRSPMPSEINEKLPQGIDDMFDRMTRDSRSERYNLVDDILDDINSIEGLADVLDQQTQVLVAENPLKNIKFREGVREAPVDTSDDVETSASPPDDKSKSSTYRPYSYQQRRKR